MTNSHELSYDIVLATRNRQRVLQLSVPLMLAQSRLPCRFIVVDSSDDHPSTRRAIEEAFNKAPTETQLLILESEAGSSYQRNIGLQYVSSPVVIFPDDDVLWYPGTADAVMRIYERDTDCAVGCVGSAVAPIAPPGVFPSRQGPYRLEMRDRVSKRIRKFAAPIEDKLLPDPMNPAGRWMEFWGQKESPSWLKQEDAELCGPVFGYRMSFRTEVIRALGGFDERLGTYSMFEDSDASLGSLRSHLNVCARRAKVFHYRVPGERVVAREFGMMAILNRAYVTCKHSPSHSKARKKLKRYLYYKIGRYFFQTYSTYGRKRFWGAVCALRETLGLIDAPMEDVADRYIRAREVLAQPSAASRPAARQTAKVQVQKLKQEDP
jgi:glycosyltransferase involved in cell wall biosynthesis